MAATQTSRIVLFVIDSYIVYKFAIAGAWLMAISLWGADVLTQHNDTYRTGANLRETILNPKTVNKDGFGKLFDVPVDGHIQAQPLVVTGLNILGRTRSVVFVATEHNSIYALDADSG